MGEHTARLALIWLRVTLALIAGVAVVLAVYGPDSVEVVLAAAVAVLVDLLVLRALYREWVWQARGCWWRFW